MAAAGADTSSIGGSPSEASAASRAKAPHMQYTAAILNYICLFINNIIQQTHIKKSKRRALRW